MCLPQIARIHIAAHAAPGIVDPNIGPAISALYIGAGNLKLLAVVALASADLVVVVVARCGTQCKVATLKTSYGSCSLIFLISDIVFSSLFRISCSAFACRFFVYACMVSSLLSQKHHMKNTQHASCLASYHPTGYPAICHLPVCGV